MKMMKRITALALLLTTFIVVYLFAANKISILDFSGGLNTYMSANQLPKNQAGVIRNLLMDEKPGSLVTRGGYSLMHSSAAAQVYEFGQTNGRSFLIKHYRGSIHSSIDNGDTWSPMFTDWKWELNPVRFETFTDYLVMTNGINDVGIFNGYTHKSYDFIPNGKYPKKHHNRLFMANTWANPGRLYYNIIGEDITTKAGWDDLHYEDVGSAITGLASYRGQLIIFTRDTTWAILGSNPLTWRLRKMNSNYGCVQQESIAMDKGTLKFLSESGIKEYNGSNIEPIDFPIRDIVYGSNNLTGKYGYLLYNRTTDFNVSDSTNIDTSMNEIKLNEYSDQWIEEDLEGTTSNILAKNGLMTLSTSTSVSTKIYERPNDLGEWSIVGFTDLGYADDGKVGTSAKNESTAWRGTDDPSITYGVTYGGAGYDITSLDIDMSWALRTHVNAVIRGKKRKKLSTAMSDVSGKLRANAVNTEVTADVYVTYDNGDEYRVEHDKRIAIARSPWVTSAPQSAQITVDSKWGGTVVVTKYYGVAGYTDTSSPTSRIRTKISFTGLPHKVSSIRIVYSLGGSQNYNLSHYWFKWTGEIRKLLHEEPDDDRNYYKLTNIYNTVMEYTDEQEEYEPSGTFELEPKQVAEDGTSISFGSMTVRAHWDPDEGTSIAFETASSTGGTNYSAWSSVDVSTNSIGPNSYSGAIQSPDGAYLKVRGDFATTISTYTPWLSKIAVNGVVPSGDITLESVQISKADGGWSYFITDDETDGQTIDYYIKTATGSDALDNTVFSAITSGDLISGTTDHTWAQFRMSLQTDDGTKRPRISSLTGMYIPDSVPVYSSAISIEDRYYLALSTAGTSNGIVLVYDKNKAWTLFDIPINDFSTLEFGNYFSNSDGVFKLFDGDSDAGTPIVSYWEKVITPDFSLYSRPSEIVTVGQRQDGGALSVAYKMFNSTEEFVARNIDSGSAGRFRYRQPSGGIRSADVDWTIVYESTSPIEINSLEVRPDVEQELR